MQINNTQSNQSFGEIKFSKGVRDSLLRRMKTPNEYDNLRNLVNRQKGNVYDIHIGNVSGNDRLFGYVTKEPSYYCEFEEGYISRLFASPVKFIKKLCDVADAQFRKANFAKELDEIVR